MKDKTPKEGEILPPEKEKDGSNSGSVNVDATIIQLVSQYTDRPDLFIDAIERHDPGFVKKLNLSAQEFSEKNRRKRLMFAGIQAYASLFVRIFAAVALIVAVFLFDSRWRCVVLVNSAFDHLLCS